ncbi:CRTAC1 family protein [Salibacteraceae bacterium]|nr:CRTAC1 family protein [Salibacteraceae bacterium]
MTLKLLVVVLLVQFSCSINSQPSFNLVPRAKADFTSYSVLPFPGGGMSALDFNNDGWDDITLTTWQDDGVHFYENHFGNFTEVSPISTSLHGQYYSVWIDYNNDGSKELFVVSESGGMQVFSKNAAGTYAEVTSMVGLSGLNGVARRGGVFGDFNNDGLLDFYLCAYSLAHQNTMFFQDTNNVFQDVTSIAGTANGFKRSFHAVIIDYNNDGLLDMYIANDFHDGNTLYKNNGDSTFTDVSAQSGAYVQLDAMGLALGDYDGDLDLDIHITDRGQDSKLLRNNNDGTFTEVGTSMGVDFVNGFGWGNNFFDADQDGDEDLYVTTEYEPINNLLPSALFINNGSAPFSSFSFPGDSLFAFCNTIGDFNKDRLTDIAVLCSWNMQSIIWENNSQISNSSLSLRFEGCESNKDAIGTTFRAYNGGSARLFSIHGSQSYMGQNSNEKIVPLIGSNLLDSLIIYWPSGQQTSHYNLQSNQTLIISECSSPRPLPTILAPHFDSSGLTICGDDSILLTLNGHYPNIAWSNGETTDSIYVNSAGSYTVTVTNQFGVSAASSPISIIEREYPAYTIESEIASCFTDGSIHLIPADSNALYSYQWSNQSSSDSLGHLNPGVYYVTITDQGECAVTDSVIINGPTNFTPIHFNGSSQDAPCYDHSSGVLSVIPSGGSEPYNYLWSTQETSSTINVPAGNYSLTISDSYNCSKDTSFSVNEPAQILAYVYVTPDTNSAGKGAISLDVFGGTSPYSIVWNDLQNQTGDSAINLFAGEYIAQINDSRLCFREIELTVPNSNINGDQIIRSNECDLICTNQANSILVSSIECSDILSKKNLIIQNILGQSIQHNVIFDNSDNANIFTEQTGIIIISTNDGQSCKIIRS